MTIVLGTALGATFLFVAMIFHPRMAVPRGDTFTFGEYQRWLSNSGFIDVRTIAVPAPSPLILATKQ